MTGVNRHTATWYFHNMRGLIAEQFDAATPELLSGEVGVDESYLGGTERAGAGGALAARSQCSGS
tara:strand:- start:254 stop:448 length:195 start_codon:yes stop_codon:yes gene_type:complete